MTVSPGPKSGMFLPRRVISSCSSVWIKSIFSSNDHLAGAGCFYTVLPGRGWGYTCRSKTCSLLQTAYALPKPDEPEYVGWANVLPAQHFAHDVGLIKH